MRSTKANIGSLSSMASKVRQEKKKSASAKAKAPLARARESKKAFKSAETVEDSSSDSDSSADSTNRSDDDIDALRVKFLAKAAAKQIKAAEAKAKAKEKVNGAEPIATTPVKSLTKGKIPSSAQKRSDDSSSESESDSSHPATNGKSSTSKPKKQSSSSESTSSSGSSSDGAEVPAKKVVVNGKAAASKESEESDSSSDEEDMPSSSTPANANGVTKAAAVDVQESSSDESESGSEGDNEGDGGEVAVARTNGNINGAKESTSQISRPQWLNNSDFMLRKASSENPGKEVADFFNNANLEGKQVWYFTAPASLPITVLKDMEIDLSTATKGGALLTHHGDNYGLDLESYATNTQIQLLIPSRGGDKYTSLNHAIDSTVHLRRMAKFGPGGEVQATATDDYTPVPKPIREQPEGLRVRYTPIGVPSPVIPPIPLTKMTPVNAPSSQARTNIHIQSSSTSDDESESSSDVEMTTPPASITPTNQTKSVKSGITNGGRKRKNAGDGDQGVKRVKAGQPTVAPSTKKHTPIQAPNPVATVDSTPSKLPSNKSKDKKERARKTKTPKPVPMTPTTAKQTPIPIPTYPGMKR